MKQTFTKRLVLFFILVIPVPLILNLVVLSFFSFSVAKTHLLQNLYTSSTNFNSEFEKVLSIQHIFLKRLANTLALKSFNTPIEDFYAQAYLEMLSLSDSGFSLCLIPLTQEQIKTKNPGDLFIQHLKNFPKLKQDLAKLAGKAALIQIPTYEHTKEPYLVLVEHIDTLQAANYPGLLVAFYPMQSLEDSLSLSLRSYKEDSCILDTQGNVLFTSNPAFAHKTFSSDLPNLPKLSPSSPAIPLQHLGFQTSNLFLVNVQGKKYIGILQNKLPIAGTLSLALSPFSSFIWETITQPFQVLLFYIITFILVKWLVSKTSKRLNQPIQELTNCMEAVWRGNHEVRYEIQPYGYEINELGNIFNCTLLLLLTSQEKAEIEHVSGDKLRKELSILSSLQADLLTPPVLPRENSPSLSTVAFHSHSKAGIFHAMHYTPNTCTGLLGLASEVGLPSYLYALSARSLFLTFSNLYSSLEQITHATEKAFQTTIEEHTSRVSMLFFQFSSHTLELHSCGSATPQLLLKRGNTLQRLPHQQYVPIESQDMIIIVTGNSSLADTLTQLPIPQLLEDSLSPITTQNLISHLIDMVKTQQHPKEGSLSFLCFP